jgi:hypothetical protein
LSCHDLPFYFGGYFRRSSVFDSFPPSQEVQTRNASIINEYDLVAKPLAELACFSARNKK